MAGTGKTTIAYTLCKDLDVSRKLAASIFCSRWLPESRDSGMITPSIAFQLAQFSGPFCSALLDVLGERGLDPSNHSPDLLFDTMVSKPLLEVKHTLPSDLVVVIDALDECVDKQGVSQLLEILLSQASDLPVKFIVSSRPEPEIRGPMGMQQDQTRSRTILHEIDIHVVRADIELHLQRLSQWSNGYMTKGHITNNHISMLGKRAGPLFRFAALAVWYICRGPFNEHDYSQRLDDVLECSGNTVNEFQSWFDEIYTSLLQVALDDTTLNEADIDDRRRLLYLVACARQPLTVDTILRQLDLHNTDRLWAALQPLWSVLHVSEAHETISALSTSFSEYMLNPSRSGKYSCHPEVMAQLCFKTFRDMRPQFNVCALGSSYVPDSKVPGLQQQKENAIPSEVCYAARNWAIHLQYAPSSSKLLQEVEEFLSVRLLLWMEVMSLRECAHKMPNALHLTKIWAGSGTAQECSSELRRLIHDAWRFTAAFGFGEVSSSTPHIYTSMLPFWPESSPISRCYAERFQKTQMTRLEGPAVDQRQCALLATWKFDNTTRSPVYSPDGALIAVGVGNEILLLDKSGRVVCPAFKGHGDEVLSIRFSPDGTRVISNSLDNTIRVWDTRNGEQILGPLEVPTTLVDSLAISPDGALIVSGSVDDTICIWDAFHGERLFGPLGGCSSGILSIRCSPDQQCMVFGGFSKTVVARNPHNGQVLNTYFLHIDNVAFSSADISPDGTRTVSGSNGNGIYVWDLEAGKVVLGPLKAEGTSTSTNNLHRATCVSFSPDGSCIASSLPDKNIYLWDTQTGNLTLGPLEGHTDSITSVSFSPDGACMVSSSYDRTLRLWSTSGTPVKPKALQGHDGSVTSVGFSPDGARIVSGSADQTLCVWDIENQQMVLGPIEKGYSDRVPITYSPDGAQILFNPPDGVALLDAEMGNVALGLVRPNQPIQLAVFSSQADDGLVIVGATKQRIQFLSADTGRVLREIPLPTTPLSDWVTSVACSPDGALIAVGMNRSRLSVYDTHSGKRLYGPLDGHNNGCRSLAFSPDSTRIVFGLFSAVIIRDSRNGDIVLGPLEGHKGWVDSVEFSPDGTMFVSGARDGTVCVWDAKTGQPLLGPAKWHTGPVRSVRFSPGGSRVVSGSDDKIMRVTEVKEYSQDVR
ncbi:hypothetical protein FRC11_004474 [Ceratobasidium sp. 423]|nr:hypothetical protein FRC11_004474 [Ceratobasidium sp. 423]